MKHTIMVMSFGLLPLAAAAGGPDCASWPMSMAGVWLKNAGIVDLTEIDEAKTEVRRLASERKPGRRYTQVYHFVFHDRAGGRYEVITHSDASEIECSLSEVSSYLVSRHDIAR
ncbi:MAG: hypothetical protein REI09_13945 [Candidatus Dactylopiibacterium sp.]|nr:hypothetical protein [Candidatus Dactylopiibacterium sp.]